MKTLIFALALAFISQSALATPPALQFDCTVTNILDGGTFENENDFTFKDFPNVTYIGESALGKTLTVGALSFSEKDETQPSVITEESDQKMTIIVAEPEDSGQIFSIGVNEGKGMLFYYSEELDAPTDVAELACP